MSLDLSSLESDLRRLRPSPLDPPFLARLDSCITHHGTDLPLEISLLEQQLLAISPAKLPPTLHVSLESAVHGLPFPGGEKIVTFPHSGVGPSRFFRSWWSAAAAVALVGAVTGLLMPSLHHSEPLAAAHPGAHAPRSSPATEELVPAGFKRGLSEAHVEGVIWPSNEQAHRVLKVVYMDRVTLKDASGRTYQVDKPRVEYILVPEKTD